MTPDELGRILSSEDLLEPSSGFVKDVMASVRRQAAGPPPLTLPWFRFVAGLAASGVMAAAGTVFLRQTVPAVNTGAAPLVPLASVAPEITYAMAAVPVSLGLTALPRRCSGPDRASRL